MKWIFTIFDFQNLDVMVSNSKIFYIFKNKLPERNFGVKASEPDPTLINRKFQIINQID